jgi:hypothetical protein
MPDAGYRMLDARSVEGKRVQTEHQACTGLNSAFCVVVLMS